MSIAMYGGSSSASRVSITEIMDLVRHSFTKSDFLNIEAAIRSLVAEGEGDKRENWRSREAVYKARIDDLSAEVDRKEVVCGRYVELKAAYADLEKEDRKWIEELASDLESRQAVCEELLESKAVSAALVESQIRELDALRREIEEKDELCQKFATLEKENGVLRRELQEKKKLRGRYEKLNVEFTDSERLGRQKDEELKNLSKEKEELYRKSAELEKAYAELESSGRQKIEELAKKIEEKEEAREKHVQLKVAYIDIEDKLIAAEEEVMEWRKKYGKLEAWTLQLLSKDMKIEEMISGKRNVREEKGIRSKYGNEDVIDLVLKSHEKEAVDVVVVSDSGEDGALCGSNYNDKNEIHNKMSNFCSGQSLKSVELNQPCTKAAYDDETCEDDILMIPTPKRKRASRVIESESEEDEGNTSIGNIKIRRLQELLKVDGGEGITQANGSATKDSNHTGICKSASRSNRRLVRLSHCTEASGNERGATRGSTASARVESMMNGKTDEVWRRNRRLDFKQTEIDDGVKVSSDNALSGTHVESEGESLGGFIVDGSDDSEIEFITPTVSEESDRVCSSNVVYGMVGLKTNSLGDNDEETDSDLALDKVLARTPRKNKSFEWEYEADMLASFSKNPELCMKAVCALYRQQTMEEQSVNASFRVNHRGFNKLDAFRGSRIANFLLNSDPCSPVLKSIRDLKKYDSEGVELCHEFAARYSKQLFAIYQNKEDPYFRSLK